MAEEPESKAGAAALCGFDRFVPHPGARGATRPTSVQFSAASSNHTRSVHEIANHYRVGMMRP